MRPLGGRVGGREGEGERGREGERAREREREKMTLLGMNKPTNSNFEIRQAVL